MPLPADQSLNRLLHTFLRNKKALHPPLLVVATECPRLERILCYVDLSQVHQFRTLPPPGSCVSYCRTGREELRAGLRGVRTGSAKEPPSRRPCGDSARDGLGGAEEGADSYGFFFWAHNSSLQFATLKARVLIAAVSTCWRS